MFRTSILFLALVTAIACSAQIPSPSEPQESSKSQAANSSEAASGANTPVPDSTGLVIVKMVRPDYPVYSAQHGVQGQVKFKLHISETGDVEDVEPISGDATLLKAAIAAAKKWKFKPYIKNGKPTKVVTTIPFDFAFGDRVRENVAAAEGAPNAVAGKTVTGDPTMPNRVRIAQGIAQGLLLRQVVPVYPPDARAGRIQGQVVLAAIIGRDGRISNLHVISGHPMLVDAAVGAVQQWRYRPYMLNGEPVEVETQILVNFISR